jgi:nucleotide-binding universal stress UspA family protein
MLKSVLVGINESEFSRAAVEVALDWASRHQASLVGLAVVDVPHLLAPQPVPLGAGAYKVDRDEIVLKNARETVERLVAEFSTRCTAANVPFRTLSQDGDPAEVLSREAQRADLLVVGRKAPSHEFGQSPSPVLDHLLRHISRPVLCVPAQCRAGTPVLVAYDGSCPAAKSLQAFQAIGLASRREIHVLNLPRESHDRHEAELAVEYLQLHGHEAKLHVETSSASPADVILAAAERLGAGVIVMGSFGRGKLQELFFGSTTKALLAKSTVPLFLYH